MKEFLNNSFKESLKEKYPRTKDEAAMQLFKKNYNELTDEQKKDVDIELNEVSQMMGESLKEEFKVGDRVKTKDGIYTIKKIKSPGEYEAQRDGQTGTGFISDAVILGKESLKEANPVSDYDDKELNDLSSDIFNKSFSQLDVEQRKQVLVAFNKESFKPLKEFNLARELDELHFLTLPKATKDLIADELRALDRNRDFIGDNPIMYIIKKNKWNFDKLIELYEESLKEE